LFDPGIGFTYNEVEIRAALFEFTEMGRKSTVSTTIGKLKLVVSANHFKFAFITGSVWNITESLKVENPTIKAVIEARNEEGGKVGTFKFKKTSGTVAVSNVSLKGSTAEGGATWEATNFSQNLGENS